MLKNTSQPSTQSQTRNQRHIDTTLTQNRVLTSVFDRLSKEGKIKFSNFFPN
jgi:hypothetical protein